MCKATEHKSIHFLKLIVFGIRIYVWVVFAVNFWKWINDSFLRVTADRFFFECMFLVY